MSILGHAIIFNVYFQAMIFDDGVVLEVDGRPSKPVSWDELVGAVREFRSTLDPARLFDLFAIPGSYHWDEQATIARAIAGWVEERGAP